jgi:Transposase/Helix-turn-helix domain of resolvase
MGWPHGPSPPAGPQDLLPPASLPAAALHRTAAPLVAPYARRTARLDSVLSLLAFAIGGEPGARLAGRLGMATNPATLLRLMRRATVPGQPTPRVLGVDDWAFRKGHRYGTIVVDLEQHRVVDVLPARHAEPLVDWLEAHPGVEVLSRDRAPAYAEAARKGAPQAVQVADRWHLIQNLVEALERCLLRFRPALKVAAGVGDSVLGPLPSSSETNLVPWQQRAEAASQQKHAITVERYERMRTLQAAGFTILDIAEMVGASRRTVYRFAIWPSRALPNGSGHLAPGTACWRRSSPTCSSAGPMAAAITRGCSARSGCWGTTTAPEPSPSCSSALSKSHQRRQQRRPSQR